MDTPEKPTEKTLEIPLPFAGPDPNSVITQEIPVLTPHIPLDEQDFVYDPETTTTAYEALEPDKAVGVPTRWANDPIMTMPTKVDQRPYSEVLYEDMMEQRRKRIDTEQRRHAAGRTHRTFGDFMPHSRGDRIIVGLAASVVIVTAGAILMVESGWGLTSSDQAVTHAPSAVPTTTTPLPSDSLVKHRQGSTRPEDYRPAVQPSDTRTYHVVLPSPSTTPTAEETHTQEPKASTTPQKPPQTTRVTTPPPSPSKTSTPPPTPSSTPSTPTPSESTHATVSSTPERTDTMSSSPLGTLVATLGEPLSG